MPGFWGWAASGDRFAFDLDDGRETIASARAARRNGLVGIGIARIDNRADLSDQLKTPQTATDLELILAAYERWGAAACEGLFGDFAFAIWDEGRRRLFCGRDHIGAVPFYYAEGRGRLCFSTAVDGLLAMPEVDDALDEETVSTYLTHRQLCSTSATFFKSIRRLPPGCALVYENGRATITEYWRPEEIAPIPLGDPQEAIEGFRSVLTQAVEDRVRDQATYGAHMTGGLDSSSVSVLAARALRGRGAAAPLGFAWQTPPEEKDFEASFEYPMIERVAQAESLSLTYAPPTAEDMLAYFRLDCARVPVCGTLMHELAVQRIATARGVQVMLSGWGGDQAASFGGRGYQPELLRSAQIRRLLRMAGDPNRGLRLRPLLSAVAWGVSPNAMNTLTMVRNGGLRKLRRPPRIIDPDFARRVPARREVFYIAPSVRRNQINALRAGEIQARLESWFETGARAGLTYRYPLLDRRVLEYALSLPPDLYMQGGVGRWIMRKAIEAFLPAEAVWNFSKYEPLRAAQLGAPLRGAIRTLLDDLDARKTPPPRSEYVNTPLLKARMAAALEDEAKFVKVGQFRAALELMAL